MEVSKDMYIGGLPVHKIIHSGAIGKLFSFLNRNSQAILGESLRKELENVQCNSARMRNLKARALKNDVVRTKRHKIMEQIPPRMIDDNSQHLSLSYASPTGIFLYGTRYGM